MHPQHWSSLNFRCVKLVMNTVATEAIGCVVLIDGLIDETQMYSFNNVHLIWVNRRSVAYLSHGGTSTSHLICSLSYYGQNRFCVHWLYLICNKLTFLLPVFMHLTSLRIDSGSPSLPSRWKRSLNFALVSNSDCCNDFGFSTLSLSVFRSFSCTR